MSAADQSVTGLTRAILTVGIAVTTLAVAVVGFLEVRAEGRSTAAAQKSQQYSVNTLASLLQKQEQAKVDYENFLRSELQSEQAGNAFQQAIFSSPGNKALLDLVQQRYEALAAKTQALTPITQNGIDGPNADPTFPRHAFARASASADRFQALQDAANARNSEWESRGAKYTAILTLLAVSLYLFGLALAMPKRIFGVFGGVGVALLVVGIGWAILVTTNTPGTIPDSAAQEYSDGEIALETSTIGQDDSGFQQSIEDFTEAIGDWPGFARAYLGRANATLSTAPETQASLIPTDALQRVISDLDRAESLGLGSGLLFEQLSGSEFALALHGQGGLFSRGAADAQQAIDIVPNDPVARYSLAISLLGAGKTADAEAAYQSAIEHTLYLDVGAKKPRNAQQIEEQWVSGALSDLEALRVAKPQLGTEIDKLKGFVVGSMGAGKVTEPSGSATFAGVHAAVLPNIVQWYTEGSTGFDPSSDVVSAQWYERTSGKAWIGIPEVSGPSTATQTTTPRATLPLTSRSIPPRCLGTGDYRVELYVGGHLAGSAETSVQYGTGARAFIDRALNLEVCHPADWRISKNGLPGFRQGLSSPDGSEGVYLIRYDLTLLPASLRNHTTEQITQSLLESTVNTSKALFPSAPTGESVAQHQATMGFAGSTQTTFSYQSGYIYGQCAIDPKENAAFVTLAYGPQTAFAQPTGDLFSVVESLGLYDYSGSSY